MNSQFKVSGFKSQVDDDGSYIQRCSDFDFLRGSSVEYSVTSAVPMFHQLTAEENERFSRRTQRQNYLNRSTTLHPGGSPDFHRLQ
jgi:hypothetical protein